MVHEVDADGSGVVEFDEFVKLMDRCMVSTTDELKRTWTMFDVNGDGSCAAPLQAFSCAVYRRNHLERAA